MDLTVKRSALDCCERVFTYAMPVEEAVETVVPDTLPDAERILCAEGTAVMRSKDVLDGAVKIGGSVNVTVLYAPEEQNGVCTLESTVPLSVELEAPEVTAESLAVAQLTVINVDARLLNPRKVLLRVVVGVFALAFNRSELELSSGLEGEGAESVETLSENAALCPVVCVKEKSFVVSDEYALQPGLLPMGELLWHRTEIIPGSVRSVGERVIFNGTVLLQVIYRAEGSGELCSVSFDSEFSQMLDAGRELAGPECSVYSMLTAEYIEPVALSGGERGISAEYHIVSQCVCSDTLRAECLADCYSNSCELELERESVSSVTSLRRGVVRASASELLPASPSPVAIIRCICRAGTAEYEAGRARCSVNAAVLYLAADGGVYSAARRLSCEADAGIQEGESVSSVRALRVEGTATIAQGGIDLRVQAELELLSARPCELTQITSVTSGEAQDAQSRPSVTVVRAGEGDTLWSLGKRCHSTAAAIKALNKLQPAEDLKGRVLLIPRA